MNRKILIGIPLGMLIIMWILEVNYALRLSITVFMISVVSLL